MTRRVVFIVLSTVLIVVGGLVALGGGALLAALGPRDTLSGPVSFDAQVAVTVPHLFAISGGLLGGGLVVLVAGVVLLVAALRTRPGPPAPYPGYVR